ncbi:hypothetical protein L6164_001594 [Bauhinia variegata]|uniref:Uncharacterized protein n=1 Tax=Bauhinia variegata TaxID=167791 RepID=A0ACB9Q997_BAUVA|nr:hypothetical protein L6164_001594 [Bauhinia variegata]
MNPTRSASMSPACWSIFFWVLHFFPLLIWFQLNAAAAIGNQTDHLALLKFKESISKDPYGILAFWNSTSHFCTWNGIICSRRHERVTVLNLQRYGLHGFISPHLGNLSFLRILNLQDNSFNDEIPQELGRLIRLQELMLTNNTLAGNIPTNLTSCSQLKGLYLERNNLTGKIPREIDSLRKLERLFLSTNMLTGQIPTSIGNLSSLSTLHAQENSLEGSPPEEIGHMKNLTILNISVNKLSGKLPSSLYNMSSLTKIYLTSNQFRGSLPANMFVTLPSLQQFAMAYNQMSGPIPTSVTNASKLILLDFVDNHLVGQVPSLGNLKDLQILNLAENSLGSNSNKDLEFLKLMTNCSKLRILGLTLNSLGGSLPNSIGNLSTQLESLYLGGNQIYGEIPATIGNLVHLDLLAMESNHLSGIIPTSFGKLHKIELLSLQFLDLSQNNLSGSIPQALQGISTLEYLNISFNMLDGEVPTKGVFANASAVAVIGKNKLCGGISELQLPPCPMKATKKKKRQHHKLVVVIICVVVFLLLLSSILTIYCLRKRNRKSTSNSPTIDLLSKVSYQSLYQATDGFSPSNLIGTGGFGSVYKGRLESEEGVVAIKVLNLRRTGADKSFIAECNALRNIRHRNLVKILTCCSSIDYKGQTFKALVFEYMTNGCLENWLHHGIETAEHQRTLDLRQRLTIVIDIASALHYLHIECKQPIAHCDLKPSNILLDDDLVARVGDFGLARLLSTITSLSNTSTIGIKGTIGYAPPEYGMGSEVSREGDMYSFGILMSEILTGRRPTEEMFKEGYNLHNHVRTALPDNLSQIIDPALLPREFQQTTTAATEAEIDLENPTHLHPNVNKCLLSLCRIGLACSVESPNERMNVVDVTKELNLIKKAFLADGINGGRARI